MLHSGHLSRGHRRGLSIWSRHYGLYLLGAGIAAILHLLFHRAWMKTTNGTARRALLDGLSHGSAALAVTLPAAPLVPEPGWFVAAGLAGSLALDLDHIVAAQSLRLEHCMTMPGRPPTHSFLFVLLASVALAGLRPWRGLGLGLFLGLGSHLLRDLGTGGAPALHPRRVYELAYPACFLLTAGLAVIGRLLAASSPPLPFASSAAGEADRRSPVGDAIA
ncbi:hypothetical protein HRbin26_00978 [bacterium HR26]|nr:hypothetical protein HRbin26_00978 [bacterium HR26]